MASTPQWDDTADAEDTYGGIGGQAEAAAAGVARGATFGLSDQALVHSGLVDADTLKGLQETNPVSSVGGELAGVVGPALMGDELGAANIPKLVTKLGGKVEGKAAALGAGKVASTAAGLATEGAVYGAGQSVSENALGDHDLVSEKTLANIGLSAAFMGSLGAITGKAAQVWGRDLSSAEDKFAAQRMALGAEPGSEEAVISQTDLPAEDKLSFIKNFKSQKPGATAMRQEFQDAGLPEVLGMMSDNSMVQKYASAISQLPTMAGDAVRQDVAKGFDQVDKIIKDSFNVNPVELMDRESGGAYIKELVRNKFDQMMEPLKTLYKAREELGKVVDIPEDSAKKVYDDLVEQSQNFRNVTNPGRNVLAQASEDFLKEAVVDRGGMANLDAYGKQLASNARQATRLGDHDSAAAYYQARDTVDKFLDEHLGRLGKQVEKEGIEGASTEAQSAIKEYKALRKDYAGFKDIVTDFAKTTGLGKRATTGMGLQEALEKIPNEKFVDHIFDPKNAEGLGAIKKNYPDVFTALAAQKKAQMYQDALVNKKFSPMQLLKEISTQKKMSTGVKKLLFSDEELAKMATAEKWIKNLPDKVGPSGTPEGLEYFEMAKNPIKSLIGHSVNEAGSAVGKKLIESLIKPEEADKLRALINLDKAQDKVNKSMTSKIKSILGDGGKPLLEKGVSKLVSQADFDREEKNIRENASNQSSVMDKFVQNAGALDIHAPNVSNSMKMAYMRGMEFLNSKLPNTQADLFGNKPKLAQSEITKFGRYFNVVQNPLSALDQVSDKTITPETVESLQAVYPKLYGLMKQGIMNGITSHKSPGDLSFQTKQALSQFLGEPLDQALSGNSIISNQMVLAQQPQPNQMQGQPKTRAKGLDKMDRSGRLTADYGAMDEKV